MVKNCASRWSFTKNQYMMHGQQNVKKKKMGSVIVWRYVTGWLETVGMRFNSVVDSRLQWLWKKKIKNLEPVYKVPCC
jgi:hypothetical protein